MSNPEIRVTVRAHTDCSPEELAMISAYDRELFHDHPFAHTFEWAEVNWHTLAYIGDQFVGHADLTERVGRIGERPTRMVGIGSVMTLPAYRGRGVARNIMSTSQQFLFEQLNAEYGMLFCVPEIVPFYASLGWIVVASEVVFDQQGGKQVWPSVTMALPRPDITWEDAPIDLCGYPW